MNNLNVATIAPETHTSEIDYLEMVLVDGHQVLPEIFEVPGMAKVKMRKHRHPDCIKSNQFYRPDRENTKLALIWLLSQKQELALGLNGHTGCGKTEFVMYLADRLNMPLYIAKVHGRMTPQELEGAFSLVDGEKGVVTSKEYGPAAKAYRNGGILLLDEVDKASSDLTAAMHLLVEGKPWPLEVFKETITKHEQCFVVGTANTYGEGHDERYTSSRQLDEAFLSRFGWLEFQYPSAIDECAILDAQFPKLPNPLKQNAVKLANAYRDAALGPMRDGDVEDPFRSIFSTRVLVSWLFYMTNFGVQRSLMDSLNFVFLRGVPRDEKDIAKDIIAKIFGTDLNRPLKDFLPKKV